MRNNFILLLLWVFYNANTQTSQITAKSMYDSLYSRVHRIECKLYDGVIASKLILYQND